MHGTRLTQHPFGLSNPSIRHHDRAYVGRLPRQIGQPLTGRFGVFRQHLQSDHGRRPTLQLAQTGCPAACFAQARRQTERTPQRDRPTASLFTDDNSAIVHVPHAEILEAAGRFSNRPDGSSSLAGGPSGVPRSILCSRHSRSSRGLLLRWPSKKTWELPLHAFLFRGSHFVGVQGVRSRSGETVRCVIHCPTS